MAKSSIPAIDCMNYLFTPDRAKEDWETDCDEFKIMARNIFKKEPEPKSPPEKGPLFGLDTDDKPSGPAPKSTRPASKPSAPKPPVPELFF